MAKGGNNLSSKRSRNAKPYDINNSFVKKVATKVTDLIPQRSWISKWFNSSQNNDEMLNDTDNAEDSENEQEEPAQPPPSKRPRIRMDVTHPPGTFDIQPRSRTLANEVDPRKEQYIVHNETTDDFLEPPVAGTSGTRRLVASTPAIQPEIRTTSTSRNRADFISLTSGRNNGATNGTDDNSESSESTSGCSSLIPQVNRQEAPSSLGYNRSFTVRKRYVDDKLNFTNHLQSPRSLFLDSNPRDSLSSRRPSFNASVMNNSLERGPSLASPFYNGNTTYGGANTAGFQRRGRTLFNSTSELQLKVPNRTNIQVKSPNAAGTDSSGMSQTAKRILEALEHFSSPILDAKKIPMNSNNSPIGSKKRQRNESAAPLAHVGLRHLTRELTVPTVPDLLKLRHRQRLQDTTVAARKIVSARSVLPPSPQEYRLRLGDDEKSKYAGKVKAKDKTDFEEDVMAEQVNLPNITLPISTLPTFDIMVPISTCNTGRRGAKEELFKFASPIKVTDTSKNLKSINNFTFSKPINANDDYLNYSHILSKTMTIESNASTLSSSSISNFIWSETSTAPKAKKTYENKDASSDGVNLTNNLKTGSVMDVLGKKSDPLMDAWKSAAGMWECSQCLIRNAKDEVQCAACKASKSVPKVEKSSENSSTSSTITVSQSKPVVVDCFGSQFKMSSNQWECDTCLVRNKHTDIKCVSCTSSRPGSIKSPPISSVFSVTESEKSDLMAKFKPAEGSWECPGCMLRNLSVVEACPCCNASKPGSLKISPKKVPADLQSLTAISKSYNNLPAKSDLGEKSKLADGSWECLSCKHKNSSSIFTCPCSSSSKSNSTNTVASGFGDKFKKPEGVWTCDDCMLQNKVETSECVACGAAKPGSKKITKPTMNTSGTGSSLQFNFEMPPNAGGFKFGIDKADEKKDNNKPQISASGFTFGIKTNSPKSNEFAFGVPQNPTGFTFGVTNPNKNKSEVDTETKKNSTTENQTVSKKRSLTTEAPKNPSSFSFGVSKTEEVTSVAEKKFGFSVQPAAVPTAPVFSFGGIKTDSTTTSKSNELPKVSFDIPSTDPPKLNFSSSTNEKPTAVLPNDQSNLLITKPSDNIDIKSAVHSTFSTTSTVSTVSGSISTAIPTSAPTPGVFTFVSSTPIPTQPENAPVPSFGQNPATAITSLGSSAVFIFGSNKPASTTSVASSEKSSALSFGSTNTSAFSATNPTPLFEGNENKSVSAFGVAENKPPSLFGATETKTPGYGTLDNKTIGFGNAKESTTAFSPAVPTFGGSSVTPAFGSTTSAFGTVPTPAFGSNSASNMFTTSKPTETAPPPASGLFAFSGSTTQSAPQSSSRFNFSGNNPAPTPAQAPVQKNLFSFGNNTSTPQSGTGFGATTNFRAPAASDTTPASFAFNPSKPDAPSFGQTTPITTPMFGTPQSTASFGQNQATPTFGSATPAPSSGFNFGGSVPAASSGFNFGGQAPAAAPAGGFIFNAPNPSPAIAFDPNTPPTFNFTGGSAPTAFNATPQAAQQQRKIKKAVRRTQQPR